MAMRPQGGRVNPSRPPRLIIGRVYEQFKPMSEWRQEDDHDTLLVYLPGFQKEYIKVTTESKNIVRVRGERLVAENKWSRFQEDFQVPGNCEMSRIQARFDGGILTITMPKKMVAPPAAPAAQVALKAEEQPSRRTKQEEAPLKPKEKAKEKKPPSTAAVESSKEPDKPQTPLEGILLPQPRPPSSSRPPKQEPSKPAAAEAKEADPKFPSHEPLPTRVDPMKDKHDVVQNPNDQREIHQKGVAGESHVVEGKGKGKGKGKEGERKEKTKRDSGEVDGRATSSGFGSDKLEKYKKALKGLAMGEKNEERVLLVNMGVAVLVIVALGVHVAFTIGSFAKGN